MRKLEDLVRHETANSCLGFRAAAYRSDEGAALLRDLIALANADMRGPRFLFLGVADVVGGEREICGIEQDDWLACKTLLSRTIGPAIEPPLRVTTRALEVERKLVGMFFLPDCGDQPYLVSMESVPGCQAGSGWIRRGTKCLPLLRGDLQRLFEAKPRPCASVLDVLIGFPGDPLQDEVALAALPLDALPSELAARKLYKVLEAKSSARTVLGATATHLSRLVHVQLFGVDKPYQPHSDDSLRALIAETANDCRVADEHYAFETRAHKVQIVVLNRSARPLTGVALRVKLPRLEGVGVAERLYTGSSSSAGYPSVTIRETTIDIEAAIGVLQPGTAAPAFREPPRFWARPPAARKPIPLDCTLHAAELREPVRETLIARIVAAAARAE